MTKTTTENKGKFTYKRVEKNIAKIGPKTYRIRVGSDSLYSNTRNGARVIKKALLSK